MRITRRHFLGVSTGAAALFTSHAAAMGESGIFLSRRSTSVLLDLKSQGVLGESWSGYKAILAGTYVESGETLAPAISSRATVVIPGAGVMDSALAQMLVEMLQKGSVVLLESGGGFLNPDQFSAHRQMLRRHWNVLVEPPVDLWESATERVSHPGSRTPSRYQAAAHAPAPYIDYLWPHAAKVRDFSRIVPLAVQGGDVIGVAGKLPVALRKSVGKGTLIFLGSPIGPHLLSGDLEARRWLQSVLPA